jgi:hypothetical protein
LPADTEVLTGDTAASAADTALAAVAARAAVEDMAVLMVELARAEADLTAEVGEAAEVVLMEAAAVARAEEAPVQELLQAGVEAAAIARIKTSDDPH